MNPGKIFNSQRIWEEAYEAGMAAMNACQVTPMVVQRHVNPLDDFSHVVDESFVPGGTCGFAWVLITPARGNFIQWCKEHGIGRRGCYGGWEIWVKHGGQSLQLKIAYAEAMASVFRKHGLDAYAGSRMD